MDSSAANGSKPRLFRFWVSPSDLAVRYETSDGIQNVVTLTEPCADTEYHPSLPREVERAGIDAEELTDLAWAALNGNCPDERWAGEDASFDAALDATLAHWHATHPEAA